MKNKKIKRPNSWCPNCWDMLSDSKKKKAIKKAKS